MDTQSMCSLDIYIQKHTKAPSNIITPCTQNSLHTSTQQERKGERANARRMAKAETEANNQAKIIRSC